MSILPAIVDSLARQALDAFDLASNVNHPGEGGSAREHVVRRFLESIVPSDFGVDTGFVIDARGGVSRQIDVVIFRKAHCPVLDVGGVRYFMVESVAAVIECKASIQSKERLVSALDNLASVKDLDRSNEGRNRILPTGGALEPREFRHQVWAGIVTADSLAYNTCLETLADWLEAHEREHWPNTYLDMKQFLITYVLFRDGIPWERTSNPMAGQGLQGGEGIMRATGFSPPLAFFGVDLLDFLRVAPIVDFSPSGYFYRTMLPLNGGALVLDPEAEEEL